MSLGAVDHFVTEHDYQGEDQNAAQRAGRGEKRSVVVDEIPEPFAGGDEFSHDGGDDRVGKADLESRRDPRDCRRNRDFEENLSFIGAHDAQNIFQLDVDPLDARVRVEEREEEDHSHDQNNFGVGPDAEPDDEQRRSEERRVGKECRL